MIDLKHQYNSTGKAHRIVELDSMGFLLHAGDWVGYIQLAWYEKQGITYVASSSYFLGSPLEPDAIYSITQVVDASKSEKERIEIVKGGNS